VEHHTVFPEKIMSTIMPHAKESKGNAMLNPFSYAVIDQGQGSDLMPCYVHVFLVLITATHGMSSTSKHAPSTPCPHPCISTIGQGI
jgi:hypothetical protein